jgi:hypothetical protein
MLQSPAVKDQFFQCVRSGQATPVVREMVGDGSLPTYSTYLDQGDRVTRGWFVTMCDPSLPEAGVAGAAPPAYTPMSVLSAAASYLSSSVPAVAAPTAVTMPSAFVPDQVPPPVRTASLVAPPVATPPPPAATTAPSSPHVDLQEILAPHAPAHAAAPKAAAPAPAVRSSAKGDLATDRDYTKALDQDLSDLSDLE